MYLVVLHTSNMIKYSNTHYKFQIKMEYMAFSSGPIPSFKDNKCHTIHKTSSAVSLTCDFLFYVPYPMTFL